MYYVLENMKRNKTDLCLHRQLIFGKYSMPGERRTDNLGMWAGI